MRPLRSTLIFLLACLFFVACDDGGGDEELDSSLDLQTQPDLKEDQVAPDQEDDEDTEDQGDAQENEVSVDLEELPDQEDQAEEVEPDTSNPSVCAELLVTGETFEVAPGDPDTQIHAAVAFDGEGVWVAYNLPDAQGGFDTFATRLGCDGTTDVAPFGLHDPSTVNDTDPSIAARDGVLYAAWQGDNGTGVDNMDVYYRTFDTSGVPLMSEALILETTSGGDPVTGNAWMPDVAALPGGGFVIAAARASAEHNTFLAFAQRIEDQGGLIDEAIEAGIDGSAFDQNQAVVVSANGDIHMSFARSINAGDAHPSYVHIPNGASDTSAPPEILFEGRRGKGSDLAVDAAGALWVVMGADEESDPNILVRPYADPSKAFQLGAANKIDHSPGLAFGPDGGAVAFYRVRSGIRNDIVIQGFHLDGDTLVKGQEEILTPEDAAAPYGAAITHVLGDVYFVAWAEGVSPDFRIKGRFVEVGR